MYDRVGQTWGCLQNRNTAQCGLKSKLMHYLTVGFSHPVMAHCHWCVYCWFPHDQQHFWPLTREGSKHMLEPVFRFWLCTLSNYLCTKCHIFSCINDHLNRGLHKSFMPVIIECIRAQHTSLLSKQYGTLTQWVLERCIHSKDISASFGQVHLWTSEANGAIQWHCNDCNQMQPFSRTVNFEKGCSMLTVRSTEI